MGKNVLLSADAGTQCQLSIQQCFRHPPLNITLVFQLVHEYVC